MMKKTLMIVCCILFTFHNLKAVNTLSVTVPEYQLTNSYLKEILDSLLSKNVHDRFCTTEYPCFICDVYVYYGECSGIISLFLNINSINNLPTPTDSIYGAFKYKYCICFIYTDIPDCDFLKPTGYYIDVPRCCFLSPVPPYDTIYTECESANRDDMIDGQELIFDYDTVLYKQGIIKTVNFRIFTPDNM